VKVSPPFREAIERQEKLLSRRPSKFTVFVMRGRVDVLHTFVCDVESRPSLRCKRLPLQTQVFPMKSRILIVSVLLWSTSIYAAKAPDAGAVSASAASQLQGRFDNRQQVSKAPAGGENPIPHVVITIDPTPQKDFSLWHVHIETDPDTSFDQTWAMEMRVEHDGSGALIPYYQFKQTSEPVATSFTPEGWLSLEACALRGDFTKARIEAMSEGEPCVAVSMSVGARRALLPVGFVLEGKTLHLDMNLRGVRTRIDAVRS
jgi:hypothetical protein